MTTWIEWNEPLRTDREPYCNTLRRALPEDVIAYQKDYYESKNIYLSDEDLLDQFMVVNWAWKKEYNDV